MKVIRNENLDPLTGRSHVEFLYLCESKGDDDLQSLAEDVRNIHPGCDMEMVFQKEAKRWGWKVRVLNGKDQKYAG